MFQPRVQEGWPGVHLGFETVDGGEGGWLETVDGGDGGWLETVDGGDGR